LRSHSTEDARIDLRVDVVESWSTGQRSRDGVDVESGRDAIDGD